MKKPIIEADKLLSKIEKNSNKLWNPTELQWINYESHSWYKMAIGRNDLPKNKTEYNYETNKLDEVKYKCRKKILHPSQYQKKILLCWLDAYTKMYNETLKLIKRYQFDKKNISFNFRIIRSFYMKKIKESIQKETQIKDIGKDTKINMHILDGAIKDVCTSFKSAFTNLKNGNIKHFVIRYIKQQKKQKIMRIEKILFNKNTFCSSVLGKEMKTNDGSNFMDVTGDSVLLYNYLNGRFTLLIPEEVKIIKNIEPKMYDTIADDPGVSTFFTGYSNNHVLEIGKGLRDEMSKRLKQIDKINKSDISLKKKRKAEHKRYVKITNKIDDMQWKTINHITENYNTILLGNMSTKGIVKNNSENKLDPMTKRIALIMKLGTFRERLKYKCYVNRCNFGLINERHTTQMCSYCGEIKKDVGRAKIYNCNVCGRTIGRDINGARNIFLKGIQS